MGTLSMTAAATNPEANLQDSIPRATMGRREPGSNCIQEERFNTYKFDGDMRQTQWTSVAEDPYLGCDANLALSTFTDMDGLQQQLRQDGDIEFLNKHVMEDTL